MAYERALVCAGVLLMLAVPERAAAEVLIRSTSQADELCLFSSAVDEVSAEQASQATGITGSSDFMVSVARRSYAGTRTQALLESYTVRVQPGAYSLEVDERQGLIVVAEQAEYSVNDSLFVAIGHAIALQCGVDVGDPITLAAAADLLSLDLEVQLVSASDPSRSFCSGEPGHMTLSGELLRASLVHMGTDEVFCTTETSLATEREVRLDDLVGIHEGGDPQVEVTRIDLIDESLDEDVEPHLRSRLKYELESQILPCYQAALCRSGRRQGALSIRATLGIDGRLRAAVVSVDALDSDLISGCALDSVENIEIDGVESQRDLGFVVMFRYQNGSAPNLATSLVAATALRQGAYSSIIVGRPRARPEP